MKCICYGAGGGGERLVNVVKKEYEIMAFTDSDLRKWGGHIDSFPILSPEECLKLDFDLIVVTSQPGLGSILHFLKTKGISEDRIITRFVDYELKARISFLKSFSKLNKAFSIKGQCAEAGVFQGDFAACINELFPNRKLHLFDTFTGFDVKDVEKEDKSNVSVGDYCNTSEMIVMNKMPFPESVIIHKGYFPETAYGITGKFIFVNLDLDLYQPTIEGLRLFQDKMESNGIILVHDYFANNFDGPKRAVDEFLMEEREKRLQINPIGDNLSIMLSGF